MNAMHFGFKTVLLGGLLGWSSYSSSQTLGGSLPTKKDPTQSTILEKNKDSITKASGSATTGYFQLLGYEHDSTQRADMHALHGNMKDLLGNKIASYFSVDCTQPDSEPFWPLFDTLSQRLKQDAEIIPLILLSGHGAANRRVICDAKGYADTVLKGHEFELQPVTYLKDAGTPQEREVTVSPPFLSANLFDPLAESLHHRAAAVIFATCHGGAAVREAEKLPPASQMMLSSRADTVTWDHRNTVAVDMAFDKMLDLSSIENSMIAYLKWENSYANSERINWPIIAVTQNSPLGDSTGHQIRVIDTQREMPTIAGRFGDREIDQAVESLTSMFDEDALKRAGVILKDSLLWDDLKRPFTMKRKRIIGYAIENEALGAALAITYRVALNHLNLMPTGQEYEKRVNTLPDARRKLSASSHFTP